MDNEKPSDEDRKNYSFNIRDSALFSCPEKFLELGQKVRAKFRIWDQPNMNPRKTTNGEDWGWVSAEKDEEGVVQHVEKGYWPTVRFASGRSTCVTDMEVELI